MPRPRFGKIYRYQELANGEISRFGRYGLSENSWMKVDDEHYRLVSSTTSEGPIKQPNANGDEYDRYLSLAEEPVVREEDFQRVRGQILDIMDNVDALFDLNSPLPPSDGRDNLN